MDIWEENGQWYRLASCGHTVRCSNKGNARAAYNKGSKCKDCARLPENNPMYGRTGELNPFYGKTHSSETKDKWSKERTGRKLTPEWREKVTEAIKTNGNKLHPYQIWIQKYGKEVADQKMAQLKEKYRVNATGSNNNMYGRPTPHGTGNGWKGYYQGRHFRSLRELSFMVAHPTYKSAEGNYWRAKYQDHNGTPRTTMPDFVDDEAKVVVECKPAKLHNTPSVQLKATAMRELCGTRGYEYRLVDPAVLIKKEILQLISSGDVVFSGNYEEKVRNWNG